jgi:hypothetical protein
MTTIHSLAETRTTRPRKAERHRHSRCGQLMMLPELVDRQKALNERHGRMPKILTTSGVSTITWGAIMW